MKSKRCKSKVEDNECKNRKLVIEINDLWISDIYPMSRGD